MSQAEKLFTGKCVRCRTNIDFSVTTTGESVTVGDAHNALASPERSSDSQQPHVEPDSGVLERCPSGALEMPHSCFLMNVREVEKAA